MNPDHMTLSSCDAKFESKVQHEPMPYNKRVYQPPKLVLLNNISLAGGVSHYLAENTVGALAS